MSKHSRSKRAIEDGASKVQKEQQEAFAVQNKNRKENNQENQSLGGI